VICLKWVYFTFGHSGNQRGTYYPSTKKYTTFSTLAAKNAVRTLGAIFSDRDVGKIVVSGVEATIQPVFINLIKYLTDTSVLAAFFTNLNQVSVYEM
jgi:hypothetical protein